MADKRPSLPAYNPEDGTITLRPEDASPEDLRLAYEAIGPNVRYGGLLACALAGIYAERQRVEKGSSDA